MYPHYYTTKDDNRRLCLHFFNLKFDSWWCTRCGIHWEDATYQRGYSLRPPLAYQYERTVNEETFTVYVCLPPVLLTNAEVIIDRPKPLRSFYFPDFTRPRGWTKAEITERVRRVDAETFNSWPPYVCAAYLRWHNTHWPIGGFDEPI